MASRTPTNWDDNEKNGNKDYMQSAHTANTNKKIYSTSSHAHHKP